MSHYAGSGGSGSHAMATIVYLLLYCCSIAGAATASAAEHVRDLEVSEGAAVGTRIGFIGDGLAPDSGPPYLIVPVGSISVHSDLNIDKETGEVRTKIPLDREVRASYSFVALPINGIYVKVNVKVLDENDNAPTFPMPVMSIEFPENTPRDVKRTLLPAKDLDLDLYNTQKYNIVSGNVNNAFRLSSHRERDGVLYLDMQINGFLDRETTSSYSLVIEALDGGTPPLRGEMLVNITIQDVNDNQPIFNQSRYFAAVPENATIGTTVLQVFATDSDANENGQIEYFINRRQSDKDAMFKIDSSTGVISVNKPLDFETKELHELVIVAKDRGLQPLETTAFVSIKVTDVNDNQPTINVIFLSDDATPKISESAQPGEFVARISVNDPDSRTEYSNINVSLSGGEGHFGLTTRDNIIYLVIVSLPLDRELQPNYTLNVEATDTGTPPLHATRTINLKVTDINDNAPVFDKVVYNANVMEVSDPGSSVVQVTAHDKDEGENSMITYSLVDTPDTHSSWFRIDSRSGLVTTKAHVDCETNPVPQLTVIATDSGFPPLSSTAKVFVTIHDVNDNEPIFDQSFYNVTVVESEPVGRCILKVSATDPDCGVNAMVNYTLDHSFGNMKEFEVRSGTGEVCILSALDYETRNVYEFPVIATDRGGLSTTAMIKIQVTDANDNRPIFYPREYNVSLREGSGTSSIPVVIVVASDPDSGKFGTLTYRITSGNDAGYFRIDRSSGEIFVTRPNMLSSRTKRYHRLNISASDGGGLKSEADAEVFISVIDAAQKPPIFENARYTFGVKEDVRRGTVIGSVKASIAGDSGSSPSSSHAIRYSIYSGDPDGLFSIDAVTGSIRTSAGLDHEVRSSVLLNVQATSGEPPSYGHTQVNIEIEDVNDNAPEFESNTVKISIPENVEVGAPLYAAHARDKDSDSNGVVRYKLVNKAAIGGLFDVDPKLGHVTLTRRLDYETAERHSLVITASDMGTPSLSANLTVLVDVQDVNDNSPVFERAEYEVKVLETLPINSQIIQVTAIDLDTGNNARLTYRLLSSNSTLSDSLGAFGVFPNSGWLYLRQSLDRENTDRYALTVVATDNGTPTESATTKVIINVLDANDNDPLFEKDSYEFQVEENRPRGSFVGVARAFDKDIGANAAVRYFLIPSNTSFQINPISGVITTKSTLDREHKENYDLVIEARDQGSPARNSRLPLRIHVLDVNDNAPDIVDPQEDVISVREEQPPGTEVVRVKAIDADKGNNASITYAILNNRDSDGQAVFSIDPTSGVIRTKVTLDHEEKTIYRVAVTATDNGTPPKQTLRTLRIEVLDLNDNRPTFTSSSLVFRVREDVRVGFVVGSIAPTYNLEDSNVVLNNFGQITYALNSLGKDTLPDAFDIDRGTGSLVVARKLDREKQSEYRLEVRALDTSATNNPQSSAVTVRVDIADANDNAPQWYEDPMNIRFDEDAPVGSAVYNFSAFDADSGSNGDIRYKLIKQYPDTGVFTIDPLTGTLIVTQLLDYETLKDYVLIVQATDQSLNASERLSTTVTAKITLNDINDNAPKFVLPSTPTVYFPSDTSVGMSVAHFIAVDLDSGENARISYVISSGNEQGYFALGYDTGVLTLSKTIDPSNLLHYVNVTASDHGNPPRHTQFSLKLSLQDFVDTPPRFSASVYHLEISEDATPGAFVTRLITKTASDRDVNLTFFIPNGVADDTFVVDAHSGVVSTAKPLDRENMAEYYLPVYVTDANRKDEQFDVAKLKISVLDVNDHAPEFKATACYPLSVPENSDVSVIHTVVAIDPDVGNNGMLSYSITSGNNGNKFFINSTSGEITAKSLDREAQARYHLTIVVQDRGTPSLQNSCNITVSVEDLNDNDPKFDSTMYTTVIKENVPIDTTVLTVKASDADRGVNGKLIYSIANESQWLFTIDNKTGVISTAGHFDRERQSEYNFQVVATDNGKSNARSQRVPVKVKIADVNDNKPKFVKYPYKEKLTPFVQPGQALVKVTAIDNDQGTNAEVVYSLSSKDEANGKFIINPNTGVISATQSLAGDLGKTLHLNVLATDKGNPPQYAHGLVELVVGDLPENMPKLTFQNTTYRVTITENAEPYTDVLQLSAVRSDGRRQRIQYSFGSGNDDNRFFIDSETGTIQVGNSNLLDYEVNKEIHLVVSARSEGNPALYGYCNVIVQLSDQNDNAPKFTQQQYTASVLEGNAKGTFILQTVAFDADEGKNSMIRYHIVDGNHDNAFKIEPAFSGILKTSIVLDREIRDVYRLTVIAIDEGVPQMTGTTRIRINVVDVNDNQPTFPPHSVITVPEDTEVGTVLTTITANDVDTSPALVYTFASDMDSQILKNFSIDRFSGKVILLQPLDFETRSEYKLKIVASDETHFAQTILTVRVTDINDNAPRFSQVSYEANFPNDNSNVIHDVVTVNASDADSGENGRIKYSLAVPTSGYSIGFDGILKVNTTNIPKTKSDYITIIAEDFGKPSKKASTVTRISINGPNHGTANTVTNDGSELKTRVFENVTLGTSILTLHESEGYYDIMEGNDDGYFEIVNRGVIVMRKLDREQQDSFKLRITSGSRHISVDVTIDDVNDNAPRFEDSTYEVSISEATEIDASVLKVSAKDEDESETKNSLVAYELTSGNDEGLFEIGKSDGTIRVAKILDYDTGSTTYKIVVRACDSARTPMCSLAIVHITLEDANDNEPSFPVQEYLEFVAENESVGTSVFTARATDMDGGKFGKLNYTIASVAAIYPIDDASKLFTIDSSSGLVTTNVVFDYEVRNKYVFLIRATDVGDKNAEVKVRLEIESRDEFYPHFTERTYKFVLPVPSSGALPAGHTIGQVTATDRDKGPDGRVVYQLTTQNPYFKINRTTGALIVKKKMELANIGREISLVVTAGSGRQNSLTNMTVVEIILDESGDMGLNLAINNNHTVAASGGGIADWALGLLIALLLLLLTFGSLFVFLHMKNKRNKKVNKPNLGGQEPVTTNNYVDPSAFDTIPIRGNNAGNQFAPPKYDEIPPYGAAASSNSGAATTSELSGSEQSGSSGRGSAEDGDDNDDEEIRMINEGPLQRDSGIHRQNDDDNLSDVSVRNTQEYLARLGIVNNSTAVPQTSRINQVPLDSLIFDEETNGDNDIANFYAKLNDVANSDRASSTDDAVGVTMEHMMNLGGYGQVPTHQPSMNGSLSSIVHSEEELAGSYNWDYLLDWGPQYQPLAHVFSEIARLKDDTVSVQSGASGSSAKSKASQVKTAPPPLITGVAPRAIPVLNSRGGSNHHLNQLNAVLPRSPISHDLSSQYNSSAAMSPSFSPSLSPLATKSPSISPLVTPGLTTAHHVRQVPARAKPNMDGEMRI